MPLQIDVDRTRLAAFCRKWNVRELAVFGSAVREDFRPDSDVDVLVRFAPTSTPSLFDLAVMSEELEAVLGRPVDLLTRPAVEQSRNPYRKAAILASAETLYAA